MVCVLVLDLTATLYHSTLASLGKVEDSTLHVLNGVRLGVVTTFRPESPDAQSGYRMIEERIRSKIMNKGSEWSVALRTAAGVPLENEGEKTTRVLIILPPGSILDGLLPASH